MVELVATFSGLTRFFQQTVHGAKGAVLLPFLEQRGIDSGWRALLEAFGVKMRHRTVSRSAGCRARAGEGRDTRTTGKEAARRSREYEARGTSRVWQAARGPTATAR